MWLNKLFRGLTKYLLNCGKLTNMGFTKDDEKKLGLPLPLLKKWEFVMNTLWAFMRAYQKAAEGSKVTGEKNEIQFTSQDGIRFDISLKFYNSKYLCLKITRPDISDFSVSITHIDEFGKEGMIRTVSDVLTYAEKANDG